VSFFRGAKGIARLSQGCVRRAVSGRSGRCGGGGGGLIDEGLSASPCLGRSGPSSFEFRFWRRRNVRTTVAVVGGERQSRAAGRAVIASSRASCRSVGAPLAQSIPRRWSRPSSRTRSSRQAGSRSHTTGRTPAVRLACRTRLSRLKCAIVHGCVRHLPRTAGRSGLPSAVRASALATGQDANRWGCSPVCPLARPHVRQAPRVDRTPWHRARTVSGRSTVRSPFRLRCRTRPGQAPSRKWRGALCSAPSRLEPLRADMAAAGA